MTVTADGRVVSRQLVRSVAITVPVVGTARRIRVGIRSTYRDAVAGGEVHRAVQLPRR